MSPSTLSCYSARIDGQLRRKAASATLQNPRLPQHHRPCEPRMSKSSCRQSAQRGAEVSHGSHVSARRA